MYDGVHIKERLGAGGIADVYRASWQSQEVALKILREPERPELRDRFIREGKLLKTLEHPGLPRCLEILDTVRPALVLEILEGETLHNRLYRRTLDEQELIWVGTAILRVLSFLHQKGIVHRDVKPANIFLSSDNRVMLLDLGLAADETDHQTTLGDILGTHAYMAPEQLVGAGADTRSDLYGLGVSLYEAACASRPFEAEGVSAWLLAHRSGKVVSLQSRCPWLSKNLCTTIHQLLARDPWDRPASALSAAAILAGMRVARGLERGSLIGRSGLVGAIEAMLDERSLLTITGRPGSGLGRAARVVVEQARKNRLNLAIVKDNLFQSLQEELQTITQSSLECVPAVLEAEIKQLRAEGELVILVQGGLSKEEAAWLAGLGGPAVLVGDGLLPGSRIHPLRPLRLEEAQKMICEMLGTESLPAGLSESLFRWSTAQPGFIVSLLEDLYRKGGLGWEGVGVDGTPRWRWDKEVVPMLVSAEIRNSADQRLLELLAIAQDTLSPAVVARLSKDIPQEKLPEFQQPGLLEVIGAGIPPERATALRLELAAVMRELGENAAAVVQEARAGIPEAIKALMERARRQWDGGQEDLALLTLAPVGALVHHQHTDPNMDTELLILRGDILRAVGAFRESKEALRAAETLAATSSSPYLWQNLILSEAELRLESGAGLPESPWEKGVRGQLLQAILLERQGHSQEALARYQEVIARQPSGRSGLDALFFKARLLLLSGLRDEAKNACRSLIGGARSLGSPWRARRAELMLGEILLRSGRPAAALSIIRQRNEACDAGLGLLLSVQADLLSAEIQLSCQCLEGTVLPIARARQQLGSCPWWIRARFGELDCRIREAYGDLPAQLEGHLAGRDAAKVAQDSVYLSWHTAMLGILGGDPEGVTEATSRLNEAGAWALVARLYQAGSLISHDTGLMNVARSAARSAGDCWLQAKIETRLGFPPGLPLDIATGLPLSLQEALKRVDGYSLFNHH
jgi:tRNA A-37 threonylcarbamoyl transferase component Bud32/tetratricopeptide (TPR) repeat protein